MWIRSQDKQCLINVREGFGLTPSGLSIHAIGFNGVIGTYSTKEKALKVLDTIQFYLNKGYTETTINTSEEYIMKQCYFNVFQIPQDDEVEIYA